MRRREAIVRIGLGTAGLLLSGRRSLFGSSSPRVSSELADVAERLRAANTATSWEVASKLIQSGVDWKTMLAAIFLCGVRGIRPRPHGILHCVMMVESSFQLAESSSSEAAWLPILWNLHDFKISQEENRTDWGQWELKPPRPAAVTGAENARREFVAAMDAWDVERADRAVVTLARAISHDDLFEILWPIAGRCYAFIGHKMIYAAQVERVIRRIGMPFGEPALRSLVMTCLVGRNTTAFERSRDLLDAFPGTWEQGKDDPQQSLILMRDFRRLGSPQAQERVLKAFRDGLGVQTVWDALRLFATELFLRRSGRSAGTGRAALLPVHTVTVTNALAHAYRASKSDRTRRLMIVQAAGWLATLREDLNDMVGLSSDVNVDTLAAPVAKSLSLPGLVDRAVPGEIYNHLEKTPNDAPAYLSRLRGTLFRKAQEHHQHKYAAAIAEESRITHPRWRARILAPAVDYLAHPTDRETDLYRKSIDTLRSADVHFASS